MDVCQYYLGPCSGLPENQEIWRSGRTMLAFSPDDNYIPEFIPACLPYKTSERVL